MKRQRMNNPNKKYKELKQKQKARISDLMYRETDRFLQEKKRPRMIMKLFKLLSGYTVAFRGLDSGFLMAKC